MAEPQKKILVIDDEPDVVVYLETLLQDNGYLTVAAYDGEEALNLVRAKKPDLVTLDISMPRKSGLRFYREVREDPELKDLPIMVVTGVTGYGGRPDDFERFLRTRKQIPPPEGFVAKPIEQEAFLQMIRELLA
jgi:CheY-like chemotaxis protein